MKFILTKRNRSKRNEKRMKQDMETVLENGV